MTELPPDGSIVRQGDAVLLAAPAKINLYLHVVGRRDDGYHLLDSLVAFAGIGDRLELRPAAALTLAVDGPTAEGLAAEQDNIVLRAARSLAAAAGVPGGAAIRLNKRLPVAAGIGGGSADAAAALRGLCALWRLSMPEDELLGLALGLGADVPVCVRGRPTLVGGVGEALSEAPALPPAWLVLVNPRVGVSTPAVFKVRDGHFSAPHPLTEAPADAAALAAALERRANDLTAPALRVAPIVGEVLTALDACPGRLLARMSGSGATCFALFADQATAAAAAARLSAAQPGWWIAAAPLAARR